MGIERCRRMKVQSAAEFLSVYGFAILALAILSILIYAFILVPGTSVSNVCTFPGYITCRTLSIGTNSIATNAIILLSNSQQYAVENAIATITMQNGGSFSGACSPFLVLSGGLFECPVKIAGSQYQNQLSSGTVYISVDVCTQSTTSGCGSPVAQTYGGTFVTHVGDILPPPGCSISLSAEHVIQAADGQGDPLTATVTILGTKVAGETVALTSNDANVMLSPPFGNTAYDGNFLSSASSTVVGAANVVASSGDCQASQTITFVPSPLSALATPSSAAIIQGESQNVNTIVAGGLIPYSYQWYEEIPGGSSFSAIPGATSANYLFATQSYPFTSTSTPPGNYIFYANVIDSESPAVSAQTNNAVVTVSTQQIGTYFPIATGQDEPYGITTDSYGNVYWTDSGSGNVMEYSGSTYSPIATGQSSLAGLAIDSSGNVYWSRYDSSSYNVIEYSGGTTTTLTGFPVSIDVIAADSSGNLYFAITSGAIAEYYVNTKSSGLIAYQSYPEDIAVGGGKAYWTDFNPGPDNGNVMEYVP